MFMNDESAQLSKMDERTKRKNGVVNEVAVGKPLIEAQGLTKHYGQTIALHDVDMQVSNGITGLLGPNGAARALP